MIYNYPYLQPTATEDLATYVNRLIVNKINYQLTWQDISDLVFQNFNVRKAESTYRRKGKLIENTSYDNKDDLTDILFEIKKERIKLSEERVQTNAYIRQLAREDTLKEIAVSVASTIDDKFKLKFSYQGSYNNGKRTAILEVSDWHYGININNPWNVYNPEEARKRVSRLIDQVTYYCNLFDIQQICVLNLGDLIAGRIHLTLRLESRIDTITQIIEVSELLAQMLAEFSNRGFIIDYYDCVDNHSRLEPNKKESIDLESLSRITHWYLKTRLTDFAAENAINIHENEFGQEIITCECNGYKVGGVHGHNDHPNQVINNITTLIQQHFDLICTAHLHHFSADEDNETRLVSNGSLMGTDTLAQKIRKNSRPSQNLIIVSEKSVTEAIIPIMVDKD